MGNYLISMGELLGGWFLCVYDLLTSMAAIFLLNTKESYMEPFSDEHRQYEQKVNSGFVGSAELLISVKYQLNLQNDWAIFK